MSAETEHNEHLDLFSLKVRQKLEDHRLPVDMKGWEQIEAKMTERPRLSVWRIGGCRCSCPVAPDPSVPDHFRSHVRHGIAGGGADRRKDES